MSDYLEIYGNIKHFNLGVENAGSFYEWTF